MAPIEVTSILFKDYVDEGSVPVDNFVVSNSKLDPEQLKDGEIFVEVLYLSVDPYMRGRMRHQKSYYFIGGFEPGKPLNSGIVGVVKASKAQKFSKGDVVAGMMPWVTHAVLDDKAQLQAGLQKLDKSLLGKFPLSYFLGILGMPGLTAYGGIKKIAEPKKGEVALVSAAAGAVGLIVGQLLKHVYGCRVIGSAGSDDKVQLLKEVGFDEAFNYRTTSKHDALAEAAPDGIDIYWENVGGPVLEKVLDIAKSHARIPCCGMISQYDLPEDKRYGVKNLYQVVPKRIRMEGFIVSDWMEEIMAEFMQTMPAYIQEGKIKAVEHITEGIENAGKAFTEMMTGGNTGKAVVKVAKEDPFPVKA